MTFEGARADLGLAEGINRFAIDMVEEGSRLAAARALPARRYRVGPLTITVRTAGEALERRFGRALAHARSDEEAGQGLDLVVIDSRAAGLPPTPEWRFPFVERSHVERLHAAADGSAMLGHNIDHHIWQALDAGAGRGLYWCDDADELPPWEDGSPLRSLVHWATLAGPLGIVHAAAVSAGGRGALLAGAGGSGKSTTTAALVLEGVASAGDDLVLVDTASLPQPMAYALYDTLKLDRGSLGRLPALAGPAAGAVWADQEKARLHIGELFPERLAPAFPLHAILLPQVGHAATRIAPASAADAVRALAPTTMFLLRGGAKQTYAKSVALARRLPAFHLELGPDAPEAARAIRAWLEGLQP